MAVATPGGPETVVHGVRAALDVCPTLGVLKVDVRNAFNCIDRVAFMEEIRDSAVSAVLPLTRALYCPPADHPRATNTGLYPCVRGVDLIFGYVYKRRQVKRQLLGKMQEA